MKGDSILLKAFKNMKGKWTLALLGVLGLALLILGGGDKTEEGAARIGSEEYRAALTGEVRALCGEVEGVGEVSVLLTLEAGESHVYAESERGYITAGGEGLLIESRPPRVAGVAVVCDGGADPAVREALTEMLSAALGIGVHRVKVLAKK